MRPFKTILLPYIYLRLCSIALAATLPTLGPAQLPNLSLSPNFTSLYDNENLTFLALPSSNIILLPTQTLHAASLKDKSLPPDPTLLGAGELRTIDSNGLPPDPFYMYIPQGVVKFSNYGPAVDKIDTLRVITEATINCLQHRDPTEIVNAGALIYPEGSVTLIVGPGPHMTWGKWTEVVSLIKRFLDAYEYVRFDFDIISGQEEIGSGSLRSLDS